MRIKFWGVRGSLPAPITSPEIEDKICRAIYGLPSGLLNDKRAIRSHVAELATLHRGTAGGNTTCVEVLANGALMVIDAGSGIVDLGHTLMAGAFGKGQGELHLFFSHPHWDHILGFPHFAPAYIPGNQINIYSIHNLARVLLEQQCNEYSAIPFEAIQANLNFIPITVGQPFNINDVQINTIENAHPGKAYSFRFEDGKNIFVHASDSEYKNLNDASVKPHLEFFQNADVLVFDAQYTLAEAWQKVDWGHSSALIGTDIARAAGVKKLVLFHHDPTYSDQQLQTIQLEAIGYQNQNLNKPQVEVVVGYEGLTLDLISQAPVDLQLTDQGDTAILTPLNAFDEPDVAQISEQLTKIKTQLGAATEAIIDLSNVQRLSTASLKMLVSLSEEFAHVPIVLVGHTHHLLQIIKLAGYQDFFAVYPTVEQALAARQASEALNLPGQIINDVYQIQEKMGESRLGTVLKAVNLKNRQAVAIKVLSPALRSETVNRLLNEFDKIIKLDHHHIVKTIEWAIEGDYVYLVREMVDGPPLDDIIRQQHGRPLPGVKALEVALGVARALEHAHRHGVVHGDLKPGNVFTAANGVKVSDFGLGRLEEDRNLLQAPILHLTPAYLSPEQISGYPLDIRTDLYAFGVILYELFTGHPPFDGTSKEIMSAHLNQTPTPPRQINPAMSASLEFLILKLLAKDPNQRLVGSEQAHNLSTSLLVSFSEPGLTKKGRLIGRDEELRVLRRRWDLVVSGQGQMILVTGDTGVGKTELVQQFATRVQPQVLLVGHCDNSALGAPYHPFIQSFRTYFSTVPPELSDESAARYLTNLYNLIPELHNKLPAPSDQREMPAKQEQLYLMSHVTQFVQHATQKRPWLLILDDLQYADQSTVNLLRYLAHRLPTMALMLVGVYRDPEVTRGSLLHNVLQELNNLPHVRRLTLHNLNAVETSQLFSQIWQRPVSFDLSDRLYQQTKGNPSYLEAIARYLSEQTPEQATASELGPLSALDDLPLPDTIHAALWDRIQALAPETRTILEQAAVLGAAFRFSDLQHLTGLSEWDLLYHLDQALDRRLIQETPGEIRLRFTHAGIHQVLYNHISKDRRQTLHLKAAEVLELRQLSETNAYIDELAYHFEKGKDFERALIYNIHAARQAEKAFSNKAALSWYHRTLALLDELKPEELQQFFHLKISVHENLGDIFRLVGQYRSALAQYQAALEMVETLPDNEQALANLCERVADMHYRQGWREAAFACVDRGLKLLTDKHWESLERARLHLMGAKLYQARNDLETAGNWCQLSLDLALPIDTPAGKQTVGNAYFQLGQICQKNQRPNRAIDYFNHSRRLYREVDDPEGEARAFHRLGKIYATQENWAAAQETYRQSLAIVDQVGDIEAKITNLIDLATVMRAANHITDAQTALDEAVQLAQTYNLSNLLAAAARQSVLFQPDS